MGRARTLWLSSMLGTAMVVQAFGFAGSAGASNSMVQVGTVGVTYQVPIGVSNTLKNVAGGFWIGTTEVTYDEWYDVRTWAEKNGYTFANKGREGHDGGEGVAPTSARNEPVTQVSWRDMVVWSNAKSQKEGLTPVYVYNGAVLKDATNAIHLFYAVQSDANGYRLPTNNEWEMAARWLGTTAPNSGSLASKRITTTVRGVTHYWTPDNYASGAVEDVHNASENSRVARYMLDPTSGTKAVGGKAPNALGMYDVSGNVWERPFDRLDTTSKPLTIRGGDWRIGNHGLSVTWIPPLASMSNSKANFIGFRLARSNN